MRRFVNSRWTGTGSGSGARGGIKVIVCGEPSVASRGLALRGTDDAQDVTIGAARLAATRVDFVVVTVAVLVVVVPRSAQSLC